MKTVLRENLLQDLEDVQSGLSSKEIVQQSSCFVFEKKYVMTYNGEIFCKKKTSLDITGAVQAGPLLAILRKLDDKELNVLVAKNEGECELRMSGKRRDFGVSMEAQVLLTELPQTPPENSWKKLNADFAEAIDLVHQCASRDETTQKFTAVHIHPKWIEACDNYQMARYKIKTPVSRSILIRSASIRNIVGLGMEEFAEGKGFLHFRNSSGLVIACRLMEEYEYEDLSPMLKVTGEKSALPGGIEEVVERAEIFSGELSDDNYLHVRLKKGGLSIEGVGVSGWYRERKKMAYDGRPMEFLVPPALLVELVRHNKNECEIAEDRLKVVRGKFTYVTCLEVHDNGKNRKAEQERTEAAEEGA